MTQSETARPGAGGGATDPEWAAAENTSLAVDGDGLLNEWALGNWRRVLAEVREGKRDGTANITGDALALFLDTIERLRALAAPPAPACDCASCRAARENRSPYSCCPRRLTHGAFCICGATIAEAPPAPAPAGEARELTVGGVRYAFGIVNGTRRWYTQRGAMRVAVSREVAALLDALAPAPGAADARAREAADTALVGALAQMVAGGHVLIYHDAHGDLAAARCEDVDWRMLDRVVGWTLLAATANNDVRGLLRAARRAAGEGRADG